mgnify:CR=1 FL=1
MSNTAQEILDAVGGPGNISHFTHCATRLRFELNDASVVDKDRVEAIDGVLGAVPQSVIATRSSSAEPPVGL